MRKKLFALAIIVICAAVAAMGTYAYFTTSETATNIITTGSISIRLLDQTRQDGALADFPREGLSGVMPGQPVSKIVSVRNTGDSAAWVRIKVQTQITSDGKDLPIRLPGTTEPVLTFSVLDGWLDGGNGYYYYQTPVEPGKETTNLFETVHFSPKADNTYQGCTVNLIVSAQAVQKAHNGDTVIEAVGWPMD